MSSTLKSPITYSDTGDFDPAKLVRLFHQAPWAKDRTVEGAREMLCHTDIVICAWKHDVLVGFGRVLTDFTYRATIWDVIVDQAYQKQGIGAEIVRRILHHPQLDKIDLFWLCTRRPGFYEKLGFTSKEQTGLVWIRSQQAKLE